MGLVTRGHTLQGQPNGWVSNVGFPIIKGSLVTQLSGHVIHVSQVNKIHNCLP